MKLKTLLAMILMVVAVILIILDVSGVFQEKPQTVYGHGGGLTLPECSLPSYLDNQSNYIVEGKVISTKIFNDTNGVIFTDSEILISRNVKGDLGKKIVIRSEGGCIKEVCMGVEGQIELEQDQSYRFYIKNIQEKLEIICGDQGVMKIN